MAAIHFVDVRLVNNAMFVEKVRLVQDQVAASFLPVNGSILELHNGAVFEGVIASSHFD